MAEADIKKNEKWFVLELTSTRKRTITESQLNMSFKNKLRNEVQEKKIDTLYISKIVSPWTVAAAKALRNSLRSPICVSETIVFVTDVPIFAPIIIGMAVGTSRTKKCGKNNQLFHYRIIFGHVRAGCEPYDSLTIGRNHADNNGRWRRRRLNEHCC